MENTKWLSAYPGFSTHLLKGGTDEDTRAQLLRIEPGTVIPRHRHTGEVHAYNLAGCRKLLESGEVIGPGGYVYEPSGNVDSWMAVGNEPCIVFVTVRGAIEYVDAEGKVTSRTSTASSTENWRKFLEGGK